MPPSAMLYVSIRFIIAERAPMRTIRDMIDEARARELAQATLEYDDAFLGDASELREGWFFPYLNSPPGCNGVIINKQTGRPFRLGSAFPPERGLALYDRGWQFEDGDLVILEVRDPDQTVRTLMELNFGTVAPTYEHGVVWRTERAFTEAEIRQRLKSLPCIFTGSLYSHLERLEEAREAGWFAWEAMEYRAPTDVSTPPRTPPIGTYAVGFFHGAKRALLHRARNTIRFPLPALILRARRTKESVTRLLLKAIGVENMNASDARLHDPFAEQHGRQPNMYPRPLRWHCIFCGWECDESYNDYICKTCKQIRPFAGGSATMVQCGNCKQLSLALARFCEWCGCRI